MFLGRVSLFIQTTDAVERKIPVFWHSSTSHTLYLITIFTTAQRRRQLLRTVIVTHSHLLPYPDLPYLRQSGWTFVSHRSCSKGESTKSKKHFFFSPLSKRAKQESGMTRTDLDAALDTAGLPAAIGRGCQIRVAEERRQVLSFP